MGDRLLNEIQLLYATEAEHKVPAAPIVRQLVADDERLLPDVLPPRPEWMAFKWPSSGDVDFRLWWTTRDRSIQDDRVKGRSRYRGLYGESL
jgi:hypothetical protein